MKLRKEEGREEGVIPIYLYTYIPTCLYIHTFIHIHTYTHTYMHTYIHPFSPTLRGKGKDILVITSLYDDISIYLPIYP